jgi:hypothetical protein
VPSYMAQALRRAGRGYRSSLLRGGFEVNIVVR